MSLLKFSLVVAIGSFIAICNCLPVTKDEGFIAISSGSGSVIVNVFESHESHEEASHESAESFEVLEPISKRSAEHQPPQTAAPATEKTWVEGSHDAGKHTGETVAGAGNTAKDG